MLKNVFTILISLSCLLGCGEAFRSHTEVNDSNSQIDREKWSDDWSDELVEGDTPYSTDHAIYLKYENEMRETDEARAKALANDIEAFDVNFETNPNDTSTYKVSSVITLSCSNVKVVSSIFKRTDLRKMKTVAVGSQGGYSVRLQCTDTNCDELVAIVSGGDGFSEATILVGMEAAGVVDSNTYFKNDDNDGGKVRVYKSRFVNHKFFAGYAPGVYFRKENKCTNTIQNALANSILNFGIDKLADWFSL